MLTLENYSDRINQKTFFIRRKNMWINTEKPRITWIANQRPIELGEWVTYTKKINTDKKVKSVVVRFETDSRIYLRRKQLFP